MTKRCIVLVGLSVRAAAEAARRDGWRVIGLDAFGDADTRAACQRWERLALRPGASPSTQVWQLDLSELDRALRHIGPVAGGWLMATSGLPCEGATLGPWLPGWQADLGLRWAGSDPTELAALRDPRRFFPVLDLLGVAHPPVRWTAPAPNGAAMSTGPWLAKDFASSGGVGVQLLHHKGPRDDPPRTPCPYVSDFSDLTDSSSSSTGYWQRWQPGVPHSLTVLADGRRAALLGLNRQFLAPTPSQPWRFGGVAGPLPGSEWAGTQVEPLLQGWADRLTRHFRLRGLFSLDLLGAPEESTPPFPPFQLLEVNPRWPASAQLYTNADADAAAAGLIDAAVLACQGRLPDPAQLQRLRRPAGAPPLRGWAIAYSPCATEVDRRRLLSLSALPDNAAGQSAPWRLHDLPAPGDEPLRLSEGDPVCSVSVAGADLAAVQRQLDRALQRIHTLLLRPSGDLETRPVKHLLTTS
jgi:predicted ATP-grasp superfamily ATP-dependent carboligase